MSLPRHIRKGMLIKRIIASDLFAAELVGSIFAKNRENVQGELSLNVIIPFSIIVVVLSLHDVPKTVF